MRFKVLFLLFALTISRSYPCGWDWDTMKMEKQTFPSIHELIMGKFIRHSKAFYYWRIKDRTERLTLYPDSLELIDDLGWAYDKIGEHEKAINIFLEKEKKQPGVYETYANLGTCYIHNMELQKGVKYLKKAIEINPDAHFGREIYQIHLVEYVLSKSDSTGQFKLPLGHNNNNFYHYLYQHHIKDQIAQGSNFKKELAKAIKGISGMMHFGNHKSPVLLETLGDLLRKANLGEYPGAGHLASRAYFKASLEVKEKSVSKKYQRKAVNAAEQQYGPDHIRRPNRSNSDRDFHPLIDIYGLTTIVKLEAQAANTWFDSLKTNEIFWIQNGINPDSAFEATYYDTTGASQTLKPVHPYRAYERKNIDNEYWLNYQLQDTGAFRRIHYMSQLNDSVKQRIDSIYDAEFSFLPEPMPADTTNIEKSEAKHTEEKTQQSTNPLGVYGAAALLVAAIFVFLRMRRRS